MGLRRAASASLALIGAVLAVLGLLVAKADQTLFDRASVERSVDKILVDPDISRLLAREITKRAVVLGNLGDQQQLVQDYVEQQVGTPEVQQEIRAGILAAYDSLVETNNPRIDFNMPKQGSIVRKQLVRFNPALDNTLPIGSDLLRFTLFKRPTLPWGYDLLKGMQSAGWAVFFAGLVCVLVGLLIGPGRFGLFAFAAAVGSVSMLIIFFLTSKEIGRAHV